MRFDRDFSGKAISCRFYSTERGENVASHLLSKYLGCIENTFERNPHGGLILAGCSYREPYPLVMNNLGQMVMEASFFKDSWEVTGPSVIEAALHFFNSSKMLKQLNPTTLTIITKVPNPSSVSDCNIITDKMTARLRVWASRHLSYAGRLVLVNSVLMSLHVYWASIFLLPKGWTRLW